uniref:Uncharacterized protein n=1 Tax=Oryza meyeriana var. granulata TaxID=110450 RepID=A0A1V1H1D7_9ORYZ|nr:hypothetical protein [Oryza meyeriana var. granulata]
MALKDRFPETPWAINRTYHKPTWATVKLVAYLLPLVGIVGENGRDGVGSAQDRVNRLSDPLWCKEGSMADMGCLVGRCNLSVVWMVRERLRERSCHSLSRGVVVRLVEYCEWYSVLPPFPPSVVEYLSDEDHQED